jgi:DNA-binding SARP family transcriptional activator
MSGVEVDVLHVSLLPGFACRRNHEVIDLSGSQQKLVAALALGEGTLQREDLAARLWPDVPPIRATARLRQTLWRLNQLTDGRLLQASHTTVALADRVRVDYRTAMRLVPSSGGRGGQHGGPGAEDDLAQAWGTLQYPLLLGWDLEWLLPYQEKWELRRVQALERLAEVFLQREQHSVVLELADAAAQADPLREGPRRIAISSCLHAGEIADAHRRYQRYRELLRAELGISPSGAIPRMLLQARQQPLATSLG